MMLILIDIENISHKKAKKIVDFLVQHGGGEIRAYGNWHNPDRFRWKYISDVLRIKRVHQPRIRKKKECTDMKLMIDAMSSVVKNTHHEYCIVAGDGHYCILANELKKHGKVVYGLGSKAAAKHFVKACDVFEYI